MRVLPRTAMGVAEVPPFGDSRPSRPGRPSRKRRRRERCALGTRDPYEPDLLLIALAHEHERGHRTPAERLLLAVLEDAVRSYVRTARAKTGKGRQLFASTRDWIAARDRTWLCSFESICDALDLRADRIRRALYVWKLANAA